jgi:hypothetical protein
MNEEEAHVMAIEENNGRAIIREEMRGTVVTFLTYDESAIVSPTNVWEYEADRRMTNIERSESALRELNNGGTR